MRKLIRHGRGCISGFFFGGCCPLPEDGWTSFGPGGRGRGFEPLLEFPPRPGAKVCVEGPDLSLSSAICQRSLTHFSCQSMPFVKSYTRHSPAMTRGSSGSTILYVAP